MDNSLYTAKTLVRERAEVLPSEVTSLITDGALDVTIFRAQTEFHLTNKQTKLLENEIILVLLFFLKRAGFAKRIAESLEVEPLIGVKIDSFIQEDIFFEIQDLFTLLQDPNEKISTKIKQEELTELKQNFSPAPTAAKPLKESGTPLAEEVTDTQVQAMRTMEGDMSRIHGYGAYRAEFPEEPQVAAHTEKVIRSASQQDLLQEKPKLAGMPTYEEKD